eukprot:CAMPEP_0168625842 /NCGR_PEP_ID=MMETSP0449_2-20121227/10267_1 /TAXON_ID=1082188 /ORGANISM="Strombidium rassoulzadegani, Strain ras09" /LENGTH=127 /DNA_ID=CAMNT_0008667703 /DNA_START=118 /DNA_END=498 /DNA_ORIENTATION=-
MNLLEAGSKCDHEGCNNDAIHYCDLHGMRDFGTCSEKRFYPCEGKFCLTHSSGINAMLGQTGQVKTGKHSYITLPPVFHYTEQHVCEKCKPKFQEILSTLKCNFCWKMMLIFLVGMGAYMAFIFLAY